MAKPSNLRVYILVPFEIACVFMYAVFIWTRDIIRAVFPNAPRSLKGEIVLVTGGASGIGRGVCQEIARIEKDLVIVVWDVDEKASAQTVDELKSMGVRGAFAFVVDISNRNAVAAAADKIRNEIGDVTLLFNNAGISGNLRDGWKEDPKVVEKVFGVNILSHCWTLREFLPAMIQNGKGHVVDTCSFLGVIPAPSGAIYVASKFANFGYIESVKEDLRHHPKKPDVFFSMVYPIFVTTNMTGKLNMDINSFTRRWTFFSEPVTVEYAAQSIMYGVLHRKEHIFFSPLIRLVRLLRDILPPEATRMLYDFAGVLPNHVEVEQ